MTCMPLVSVQHVTWTTISRFVLFRDKNFCLKNSAYPLRLNSLPRRNSNRIKSSKTFGRYNGEQDSYLGIQEKRSGEKQFLSFQ